MELALAALEPLARPASRPRRSGRTRCRSRRERLVEVLDLHDGEHRAEDLLAGEPRVRLRRRRRPSARRSSPAWGRPCRRRRRALPSCRCRCTPGSSSARRSLMTAPITFFRVAHVADRERFGLRDDALQQIARRPSGARSAREQAEHFWPWKPKAAATMPFAASSRSAVSSTMIASLPPISRIARLIQIWPLTTRPAFSEICEADFAGAGERDEPRLRVLDERVADVAPPPRQEIAGRRRGRRPPRQASRNIVAMPAASDDGLRTTVLPATIAAVVMPARIASGKFHGGITTATPSGM